MRRVQVVAMSIAALAQAITWAPSVDTTLPVYNEERDLAPAVRRLYAPLHTAFPFSVESVSACLRPVS